MLMLESNAKGRHNQDKEYEICVCCHKQVKIFKDEEIEFRPFYIEGAGQLCYDCYHKIYRG